MLCTLRRIHICFPSSINSRAGRERGWGLEGEVWLRREWGSPHYLGCAALKSTGIAFITEPNEIAEADYPRDGERRQAGSLSIWEKKVKGGREKGKGEMRGGGRRCLTVLLQLDWVQVYLCACVGVCECKRERRWHGGGAAIVPFFKQGSLGRDMNNNDSGTAACKNQTNITLLFLWLL